LRQGRTGPEPALEHQHGQSAEPVHRSDCAGVCGVSGEASASAVVTLWWGSNEWARAIQQGRYWYGEALVNNATGSVWVVITSLGVVRGNPDRLQSETRSAFVAQMPETLIHDADGNLARDGRWMYSWDAENRLTRVMSYGATDRGSWRRVDWKYDAWGRRVRQTSYVLSNGVWQVVEDVKFVSDPELFGRHVAELNATNNSLVRSYVWGLDLSETLDAAGGVGGLLWVRAATGPAAGTHFVCYDGNGNVWNLVSASTGTEAARYEYGPFSEPLRLSGPAARTNPFRFSTKRTEDFTSLVLYEYRAYSPTLGRWLSRDPLEDTAFARESRVGRKRQTDATSSYHFVNNQPPWAWDYLGLDNPGCDVPGLLIPPWNENCFLQCCAIHDLCYYNKRFLDGIPCRATSWLRMLDPCSWCGKCNREVIGCWVACLLGLGGEGGPMWFCLNGPHAGTMYYEWESIPASCWESGEKPSEP